MNEITFVVAWQTLPTPGRTYAEGIDIIHATDAKDAAQIIRASVARDLDRHPDNIFIKYTVPKEA